MKLMLIRGREAPFGYRVPSGFILAALDGRGAPAFRPSTTWWAHAGWNLFGLARAFGYPWRWDEHDDATHALVAANDFLIERAGAGEVADIEVADFAQEMPRPGFAGAQTRKDQTHAGIYQGG